MNMDNVNNLKDVVKSLPISNVNKQQVKQKKDSLIVPLRQWIKQNHQNMQANSRTLSFMELKKFHHKQSILTGIIAGYKISYNPKYHQATPFLLLFGVCGLTYNYKMRYLTNHLWIDVGLNMMCSNHDYKIGIGDFVKIKGRVEQYQGWVNHTPCFKLSLNSHTKIQAIGYPVLQKHHIQLVNYKHQNYLFSVVGYSRKITLGNEIKKIDVNNIHHLHLSVGYTADSLLGHIVNKGKHIQTRKWNPKLVLHSPKDKRNLVNHLEWMKMRKGINLGGKQNATVLTTAKQIKNHPHRVFKKIKNQLMPDFRKSFDNACAWHRGLHYEDW